MPRPPIRSMVCLLALVWPAAWAMEVSAAPRLQAPPAHAPGHVIVQFKPQPAELQVRGRTVDQALGQLAAQLALPAGARLEETAFARWKRARARGRNADELDPGYFLYLHLPPGLSVEQCLARLEGHPLIQFAEPDGLGTGGEVIPNDPNFGSQWHHRNGANPGADIRTPAAWDITTGSPDVTLAVLDTGLNLALTEFTNRLVAGYDFANTDADPTDDQGHGTAVTGTAAANANNGIIVAGVDWQCRIMPIKVLDENNSGFYSWWAQGIDYAVANGAKVINLSAGGSTSSTQLTTSIDNAIAAGVIFVTITHNDNTGTIRYPGRLTQAITVGATDQQDERVDTPSWGSNWGPEIDLVAPGLSIGTVNRFGSAAAWSGTSFAAPQVAGVCALLASLNPGLTQAEAEMILTQSADDQVGDAFDTPGFDIYYGHGRLNALNAILQGNPDSANLTLTQILRPDPVSVGCPWTVSLVVSNGGPADATGVMLTNTFPAEALFLEAETSQGTVVRTGNQVVFAPGALAQSESFSALIRFQAQTEGSWLVVSTVISEQEDWLPGNNQDAGTLTVVVDALAPTLLSATALPDAQSVEVRFSEAVDPATALVSGHYTIEDAFAEAVPIVEAQPTADPAVIRLITGLAGAFGPYTLRVEGVTDCVGQPMAGPQSAPVTVPVMELIPQGATWRFLDTGVAPAADWTTEGFDDTSWGTGPAPLGYGDGDEATEIGFGPDTNNKHITSWFRRSLTVSHAAVWTNVQVSIQRDDGAVGYLNGVEVFRSNMPGGTILPSTLASSTVDGAAETQWVTHSIPASALVDGTNWLAIEVHQASASSSDLSLDLSLTGQLRERQQPPVFVRHPDSQTVVAGATVHFKIEVEGEQPMGFRWRKGFGTVVPFGAGGPVLTLTEVGAEDAGSYTVVATNSANLFPGVLSEAATLVVLPDRDGDLMPDEWEDLHGLDADLADDGGGDADLDGVVNRDEFAGGTDPNDPESVLKLDQIHAEPGRVELTFIAVSNTTYAVQFKDSAGGGEWGLVADISSAATNRTVVVEDAAPTVPFRLYRLLTPHQP